MHCPLWKNNIIIDPIADIHHVLQTDRTHRILNGICPQWGTPYERTPLQILALYPDVFFKDALLSLLVNGVDINQRCLEGKTVVHLLLSAILEKEEYIHRLRWFLNMGASPRDKWACFAEKKLFHPIDLFLHGCASHQVPIPVIHEVILLLKCYGCDDPVFYPSPSLESQIFCMDYHRVSFPSVHPVLCARVMNNLRLPIHLDFLPERAEFLLRYHEKKLVTLPAERIPHITYVVPDFMTHDISTPHCCFLVDHKNQYAFHLSMIPELVHQGRHPFTNEALPFELKNEWLHALERNVCFPYVSPEKVRECFPRVFVPTTGNDHDPTHDLLSMIHCALVHDHPYTNIMLARKWKSLEIRYTVEILHRNGFARFTSDISSLSPFLWAFLSSVYETTFPLVMNKLHFCFEEAFSDISIYTSVKNWLSKNQQPFPLSFSEVVRNPEMMQLLRLYTGQDENESSLWYKLSLLDFMDLCFSPSPLMYLVLTDEPDETHSS